jgi:uncharacterized protein (DUF58 family)
MVVDVSTSGRFTAGEDSVAAVVNEIVAALALAATRNSDRLSLVLASDRVERIVPPGSGRRHAVRLIAAQLSHRAEGKGTDLVPALELTARARGGRALVFLIGDFILDEPLDAFENALGRAARVHDIVAVRIAAEESEGLPALGWVEMTDPESGKRTIVNAGRGGVRRLYREAVSRSRDAVAEVLTRAGVELVEIEAGADPLGVLAQFLMRRRGAPK